MLVAPILDYQGITSTVRFSKELAFLHDCTLIVSNALILNGEGAVAIVAIAYSMSKAVTVSMHLHCFVCPKWSPVNSSDNAARIITEKQHLCRK